MWRRMVPGEGLVPSARLRRISAGQTGYSGGGVVPERSGTQV